MKKKIAVTILCVCMAGFLMISGGFLAIISAITEEQSQNQNEYANIGTDGLPPFFTSEMLGAAIEEQEKTGYPASVTLAQIIAESGYGRYGPGGENRQGLSGLAYNYKNLFGMKAPAGDDIPIGVINMQTGEEVGGSNITVRAGFLIFRSYQDCIKYRSGLIKRVYSDLVNGVTDPDEFARKLAGRWATSSRYGESLISLMQRYNLYRYNSMSLNDWNQGGAIVSDGKASAGQRRIAEIALSLDNQGCARGMCQAWVANVYVKAGQSPRASRACATEAANAWLISGSRSNIPIGAAVYGSHSFGGVKCGNHDAGHVGIYVGNGKIVSNEGSITIKSIDAWTGTYGWRGWGWNGREDFSKR